MPARTRFVGTQRRSSAGSQHPPCLDHEVLDAAVEGDPVVVLRRAQGDEVLARAAGAQVENETKT